MLFAGTRGRATCAPSPVPGRETAADRGAAATAAGDAQVEEVETENPSPGVRSEAGGAEGNTKQGGTGGSESGERFGWLGVSGVQVSEVRADAQPGVE